MYVITATRNNRVQLVYNTSLEFVPFEFEDFEVKVFIDADVVEAKVEELKQYQEVEGSWSNLELGFLALTEFAEAFN
jgi:hypothetical protein